VRQFHTISLIAAFFPLLTANAQPTGSVQDNALRFDAASVKLTAPSGGVLESQQVRIDPGRVHYVNIGLKDLIRDAYKLKVYQVIGPDWLNGIALDIDATTPNGATQEQLRVMFQNLLADQFKLAFHWDTKELPTYSIRVAKDGPKMKESADLPSADSGSPVPPVEGPPNLDSDGIPIDPGPHRDGVGTVTINGRSQMHAQRATMQELANELSGMQLKFPVTDETGLRAKYDFVMKFAAPEWNGKFEDIPELGIWASTYQAMEPLPELSTAMRSQLGLKLEQRRAPVKVLLVDHLAKTPTGN
jgi:uncharacterized protein (TIGR03435 family)